MQGKRLIWKIFPSFLAIIFFFIISFTFLSSVLIRSFYLEHIESDLERSARMAEDLTRQVILNLEDLDKLCRDLGASSSTRFTIVGLEGQILCDSNQDDERMDNHSERSEIKDALKGRRGSSLRYSKTLSVNTMYVAIPIYNEGKMIAVIRSSISVTSIDEALKNLYINMASGGIAISLLAGLFCFYVSRRITRPFELLRDRAEQFISGFFDKRVPAMETHELSVLAEAMNSMAKDLDEKIEAALRQRNEMEAVLASMVEGVLAIDQNESIFSLNEAAARLFNIDVKLSKGKALHSTIRNMDLYRIVKKTFSSAQTVEGELTVQQDVEKIIQVHGTLLKNETGGTNGVLLVFNDLTRLKQLESLRRDFVANVSHEIKTPLTSIKGYVETLLNGAMYDKIEVEKFLKIVLKQADRLNGIVNDLLSLSKIENQNESGFFSLTKCPLLDVIETAVLSCQPLAKERNIEVEISCESAFMAQINPSFLEQALVNLISNAIQYSQEGKKVRVEVEERYDEMVIKVEDKGAGISSEHLPRLFERFYRVDKARSRNLGGTGLGLAIVKHISQGHKGRVSVESEPGKGSVFSIFLKK